MIHGATILTADGAYFDYDAPDPATVSLNAVARGLANTCRFGGQCNRFYSVAEHSIWVSRIVPPEHAMAGLFHDAAEAFIVDMPKPLKEILPDYKIVEKRVDTVMLATEQVQLMRNRDPWKWTDRVQPLDIRLELMPPERAYQLFIQRAHELGWRGSS